MRSSMPVSCVLVGIIAAAISAQSTVTITSDRDNTLYNDGSGSLSNGAGTGVFSGLTLGGRARRAVIHFDLTSIPAGAVVTGAQLDLTVTATQAGPVAFDLRALTASWGEGTSLAIGGGGGGAPATTGDATWFHRFHPSTFWGTPGGDFSATVSATTVVNGLGPASWIGAQLTADVQAWVSTPATNEGWIVISDETAAAPTAMRFASHESPSGQPQLTVTYTTGIAGSVTSTGVGCHASQALPLSLTVAGVPQVGQSFAITLANGNPGSLGFEFLAAGISNAPFDIGGGCLVYLDPVTLSAFISSGASPVGPLPLSPSGDFVLPIAVPPLAGLAGATISIQGAAIDGAAPSGFVLSNAITLVIGS